MTFLKTVKRESKFINALQTLQMIMLTKLMREVRLLTWMIFNVKSLTTNVYIVERDKINIIKE